MTKLHILTVGVNRYGDHRIGDLKFACQDALAFAELFRSRIVEEDRSIRMLLDEEATRANVLDVAGVQLAKEAEKDDVVLILFACHGTPEVASGVDEVARYLALHDTERARIFATALDMEQDLVRLIERLEAGLVVVFLDTCFSGRAGGRTFEGPRLQASAHRASSRSLRRMEEMELGKGRLILSSCNQDQVAREDAKIGHGVFTHYLLEELRSPPEGRTEIGVGSLYERIAQKVHQHTSGQQTPTMNGRAERAKLPLL